MQFESNLSSFGKICPFSIALRMLSSASLAELLEENQVNVCYNRYNLCVTKTTVHKPNPTVTT